jgi:hypothetical protein
MHHYGDSVWHSTYTNRTTFFVWHCRYSCHVTSLDVNLHLAYFRMYCTLVLLIPIPCRLFCGSCELFQHHSKRGGTSCSARPPRSLLVHIIHYEYTYHQSQICLWIHSVVNCVGGSVANLCCHCPCTLHTSSSFQYHFKINFCIA